MDRCEGTTKAAARCKRSARPGSRFCATHAGQEKEKETETAKAKRPDGGAGAVPPGVDAHADDRETVEVGTRERDDLETLLLAAAVGVAAVVMIAIGRLFRA